MRFIINFLLVFTLLFFHGNFALANSGEENTHLLINIPAHWLRLYHGNKAIVCFPVAVGKVSSKTPIGDFSIIDKEVNPTWVSPENPNIKIPSGSSNPLGYRWIGIGGNYGIHGTNHPDSIGKYISGGCIRMHEQDIEEIYRHVKLGTPVKIIYNRLVVEKAPNGMVDYYVYEDGYNRQPLSLADIKKALNKYGVADFLDDKQALNALKNEDGNVNYVAYPIKLHFNEKKLPLVAVKYKEDIYLPLEKLSKALNIPISLDFSTKKVSTQYGICPFIEKNKVAYLNYLDVTNLFNIKGEWETNKMIVFYPLNTPLKKDTVKEEVKENVNPSLLIKVSKTTNTKM